MNKLFSLVAIFATVVMASKKDGKTCSHNLSDKSTKTDKPVKTAKSNNGKKPNRTLGEAMTTSSRPASMPASSKSGVATSTAGKPTVGYPNAAAPASKPRDGSKPATPATPAKPVKGKGNKLAEAITAAKPTKS